MKKLFLGYILLMLLSCSNKSTKPDFLVSDLVGKWTNPKNKQDYFRITDGGFLESQGVYIVYSGNSSLKSLYHFDSSR